MAIINKTGIADGNLIQSEHVTRIIDALTSVSTDTVVATGSFQGTLNGTATNAITASYIVTAQTASYVLNAVSASRATSASFASRASTASFVNVINTSTAADYYFTGIDSDNGTPNPEQLYNLGVTYNPDTNTMTISGGGGTVNASGFIGALAGVSFYGTASFAMSASHAVTASFAMSASRAVTASFATSASLAQTASYVLNSVSASFATTASFVLSGVTASFATSASQAISSSRAISASFATSAETASFVITAATASYVLNAVSASFATSASRATSSSFAVNSLTTASVSSNIITFTKGDGTTFPITVNTGSSASSTGTTWYTVSGSGFNIPTGSSVGIITVFNSVTPLTLNLQSANNIGDTVEIISRNTAQCRVEVDYAGGQIRAWSTGSATGGSISQNNAGKQPCMKLVYVSSSRWNIVRYMDDDLADIASGITNIFQSLQFRNT